jgi:uncharacterized protein (DUF433 family)/DNA-binding transcriptional MerR regulator
VLRPGMTSRKIHHWLDEGILGEPIRWGRPGVPTLLSFHQVLRIRVLQRLRDDLGVSLSRSRAALQWLVEHVLTDDRHDLRFFVAPDGHVGVTDGVEALTLPSGQSMFSPGLLQGFLEQFHEAWVAKRLRIAGFPSLVSDPRILGGAPVIEGTRIETAFVAHLARGSTLPELQRLYPHVGKAALTEAVEFEGIELAA